MSDRELRELERRFRATGSFEDERALLRARIRSGLLAVDRLVLAALCGDPVAADLLPADGGRLLTQASMAAVIGVSSATLGKWSTKRGCPRSPRRKKAYDPVAVMRWRRRRVAYREEASLAVAMAIGFLEREDPQAAWRAAIAAAWAAWGRSEVEGDRERAAERIEAIEARLLDPSLPAAAPATAPSYDLPWEPSELLHRARASSCLEASLWHLEAAERARSASSPDEDALDADERHHLDEAAEAAFWMIVYRSAPEGGTLNARVLARVLRRSFERVATAIESDVPPWALELGDPLAERVGAREAGRIARPELGPTPVDGEDPLEDARLLPTPRQLALARRLLAQKGVDADGLAAIVRPEDPDGPTELEQLDAWLIRHLIDELMALPDADGPADEASPPAR